MPSQVNRKKKLQQQKKNDGFAELLILRCVLQSL